jgi:hypothetical protein
MNSISSIIGLFSSQAVAGVLVVVVVCDSVSGAP